MNTFHKGVNVERKPRWIDSCLKITVVIKILLYLSIVLAKRAAVTFRFPVTLGQANAMLTTLTKVQGTPLKIRMMHNFSQSQQDLENTKQTPCLTIWTLKKVYYFLILREIREWFKYQLKYSAFYTTS
jgi:hypothetical protein